MKYRNNAKFKALKYDSCTLLCKVLGYLTYKRSVMYMALKNTLVRHYDDKTFDEVIFFDSNDVRSKFFPTQGPENVKK